MDYTCKNCTHEFDYQDGIEPGVVEIFLQCPMCLESEQIIDNETKELIQI